MMLLLLSLVFLLKAWLSFQTAESVWSFKQHFVGLFVCKKSCISLCIVLDIVPALHAVEKCKWFVLERSRGKMGEENLL